MQMYILGWSEFYKRGRSWTGCHSQFTDKELRGGE